VKVSVRHRELRSRRWVRRSESSKRPPAHRNERRNLLSIFFLFSVGLFIFALMWRVGIVGALERISLAPRSDEEQRIIDVYREVNEGVVFVTTITLTMDPFDFYAAYEPRRGTGSGVIVDAAKGLIVTNLHVIGDADRIEVTLADGRNVQAKLVGEDEHTDMAILRLAKPPEQFSPPLKLTEVAWGDSSQLAVGQKVLAIGNPFGLNRTLTTGIISSLDRVVKTPAGTLLRGLIQTDAAINPGNSGGPLLDMAGRLIGINGAILSQSGDSAGIGFATPINVVHRILPQLVREGKVRRPHVGWELTDTLDGPMVLRVVPKGPADVAGLEPIERQVQEVFLRGYVRDLSRADLIEEINGTRVRNKDRAEEVLDSMTEGGDTEIVLKVRHGGKKGDLRDVVLKPEYQ
jgi:S1-C subfamily serine protease